MFLLGCFVAQMRGVMFFIPNSQAVLEKEIM